MTNSLDKTIDALKALDLWRIEAATLRDEGKQALLGDKLWHDTAAPDRHAKRGAERRPAGSRILEDASVLQALLTHRRSSSAEIRELGAGLTAKLNALELKVLAESENDHLPVLRAARTLTALAAAPDSALSATALACYFLIMRELYTGDGPDWLIGGARGGEGLRACAFVTNECIHALLGFERTLRQTAEYIDGIAAELLRRHATSVAQYFPDLAVWHEINTQRAELEFRIAASMRTENIALKLGIHDSGLGSVAEVTRSVAKQVGSCVENFVRAITSDVPKLLKRGRKTIKASDREAPQRRIRAEAGNQLAFGMLIKAFKRTGVLTATAVAFEKLTVPIENGESEVTIRDKQSDAEREEAELFAALTYLENVVYFLKATANDARSVLEPTAEYVSRALDRELTAASSGAGVWDVGELLFAAISHGYISNRWGEERLRRAARHASAVISERGQFPAGHAIHLSRRGYNLHVPNVDIIRAFAELLQNTGTEVEPDLISRLMAFMDDTRVPGRPGTWAPKEELAGGLPWRSATAGAVLALDALNQMLDTRINGEVLRHFSVRYPTKQLKKTPLLSELFYPDYGLVAPHCTTEQARSESVAIKLLRMRAHVNGVRIPSDSDPLFSLILHGPPGTGKTTLVESLAKSSGSPLVEITPSDLIADGVDSIERTTRAVFRALSLLTRVVILFDEFDPVLLQRQDDQKEPTAFSFLTPGMLPKLKDLHESAARRSVSYVLITNLIGKLDDAAIREGRFDAKVGIYPPDLLSRSGRLASEIERYRATWKFRPKYPKRGDESKGKDLAGFDDQTMKERYQDVVLNTRLGSMNTLGRPGWFTAPIDRWGPAGDIFNYLLSGARRRKLEIEAEPRFTSDKSIAMHELKEFMYVDTWDQVARGATLPENSEEARRFWAHPTFALPMKPGETGVQAAAETAQIRTLTEALNLRPTDQNIQALAEGLPRSHAREAVVEDAPQKDDS